VLNPGFPPKSTDFKSMYARLHKIEPSLPENPVWGNEVEVYIEAFLKVESRQKFEIEHFSNLLGIAPDKFEIMGDKSKYSQLEALELMSLKLDVLNVALIEPCMDDAECLDVSAENLTRFPIQLFTNPDLRSYWLGLKKLNLAANELIALPKEIEICQSLEKLNCSDNEIKTLPESLGNLRALQKFICCYNPLVVLPESLGNCRALKKLDCSYTRLATLPEGLGHCVQLEELGCFNALIAFLPDSLGNCANLKGLYCSSNRLTYLPVTLGNCKALIGVNCGNNQLTDLPNSLGNCTSLEWIRCENNQLTALPRSLANCQRLSGLEFERNKVSTLPEVLVTKLGVMWGVIGFRSQLTVEPTAKVEPSKMLTPAYQASRQPVLLSQADYKKLLQEAEELAKKSQKGLRP
jgi:hypothetical protein